MSAQEPTNRLNSRRTHSGPTGGVLWGLLLLVVPPAHATPPTTPAQAGSAATQPNSYQAPHYQPVDCQSLLKEPLKCSAEKISEVVGPYFKQKTASIEERKQAQRDGVKCLEQYYQKTGCRLAICQLANGFEDAKEALLQDDPLRSQLAEAAKDYGALCLSCVRETSEIEDARKRIKDWSDPPKSLGTTPYYVSGGLLLGVGVGLLATGAVLGGLHNKPNGDFSCMSGGLPSECLTNYGVAIGLTIPLGAALIVGGGLSIWGGCHRCNQRIEKSKFASSAFAPSPAPTPIPSSGGAR